MNNQTAKTHKPASTLITEPCQYRAKVLDKAMLILSVFNGETQTVAAIATVTGIPRPTVHRLLNALAVHDLVDKPRTGCYLLSERGSALFPPESASTEQSDDTG